MTMGRRRKHTHTDLDTLRPQNKNQQCCTEAGTNEMNVNMLKIFADMIASMFESQLKTNNINNCKRQRFDQ